LILDFGSRVLDLVRPESEINSSIRNLKHHLQTDIEFVKAEFWEQVLIVHVSCRQSTDENQGAGNKK
jgi:hypothetical protein